MKEHIHFEFTVSKDNKLMYYMLRITNRTKLYYISIIPKKQPFLNVITRIK